MAATLECELPQQEPFHFSEVVKHFVWQKAMTEEYKALVGQGTWTLVPLPPAANVIRCQWIYKFKRHQMGL